MTIVRKNIPKGFESTHRNIWHAIVNREWVSIIQRIECGKRIGNYSYFEIYSQNKLFKGVERYKHWSDIVKRLKELEAYK